jgi:transposase
LRLLTKLSWRLYLALSQLLALSIKFAISKLRLSKSAVDEIALLFATNVEPRKIAQNFCCHISSVYQIQQNINTFRETRPAPLTNIGRPQKITPKAFEGLLNWLLDNSSEKKLSYLDEIVAFLDEEYNIEVSKSTVCRTLAKKKITQKAVSIILIYLNSDSLCRSNVKLLSEMRTCETIVELKYSKFLLRRLYSSTNRLRMNAQKTVKEAGLHAAYPAE